MEVPTPAFPSSPGQPARPEKPIDRALPGLGPSSCPVVPKACEAFLSLTKVAFSTPDHSHLGEACVPLLLPQLLWATFTCPLVLSPTSSKQPGMPTSCMPSGNLKWPAGDLRSLRPLDLYRCLGTLGAGLGSVQRQELPGQETSSGSREAGQGQLSPHHPCDPGAGRASSVGVASSSFGYISQEL